MKFYAKLLMLAAMTSGAALFAGANPVQNPEFAPGVKGWKYWNCKPERKVSRLDDKTGSCRFEFNGKDKVGHVEQKIVLNQKTPVPVRFSAWCKAEDTTAPEKGYKISLPCTVVYQDGKKVYAASTPFPSGNFDWQERQVLLMPEKPVKAIIIYGRANNFSGKVYFDSFKVEELPELGAGNLVKNSRFSPLNHGWKYWNCKFDPSESRTADGSGSCRFDYKNNSVPGHVEQTVELNQTEAEPIALSVWCKTDIPDSWGEDPKNFAFNTCLIFADGTKSWKNRLAIPAGKSDWKEYQFMINAGKPVKSIIIYGRYANHKGKVWFDEFSVETVSAKKKSNVTP